MTLTRRIPGGLERVDNKALYERWLADVSGYDRAATEVVKRVLRIVAQGAPARPLAPSTWSYGLGPSRRAPVPGDGGSVEQHLAAMGATAAAPPPRPVAPRTRQPGRTSPGARGAAVT